jgi:hypothetical protein
MAAIAYPCPNCQPAERRHLTVVPPPARRLRPGRVYGRRRLAVLLAHVLLVIAARAALGALGGGPLAATGAPAARGGAGVVYVVQPGDTYWSIARRVQPSGDLRDLVDRLSADHGGASLQPGERLVLR